MIRLYRVVTVLIIGGGIAYLLGQMWTHIMLKLGGAI